MAASTTNVPAVYSASADVPSSSSSQPHPQLQLPSSAEHAAHSSAGPSATAARLPENMLYKNRLQEFAQKSSIALPLYQNVNEGTPHAPRFRSTVWVNERSYTTEITFSNRKAAEQDAARLALESLPKVIKDEATPLVSENILFSKSILNEFATKVNVERPTYNTVQLKGLLPLFVSILIFNGAKYTGDVSRNKKEAEQFAAHRAILSILDGPSSGTLFEILKSKSKIFAAIKSLSIYASNVSDIANTGHSSGSLDNKDKEVADIVTGNNNETKTEPPMPSKILSSCQASDATPAAFLDAPPILPNVSSEQPSGDGSSSKKRRRNKKKANKKARLESPLPVAAFPVNEMLPCSVAQ